MTIKSIAFSQRESKWKVESKSDHCKDYYTHWLDNGKWTTCPIIAVYCYFASQIRK